MKRSKQQEFEELVRKHIHREGIEDLLSAIAKTDFYTAPASTRYHHSFEGGLAEHSIDVFYFLCDEMGITVHDYSMESIAIVALLHDVCKIGFYKVSTRNVKDEVTGKWTQQPYYTVDDLFPMGHGEKSLYMVNSHMRLTDEEALAIRWHMGGYEPKENYNYVSGAYNQSKLALLLHLADMRSTYIKGE